MHIKEIIGSLFPNVLNAASFTTCIVFISKPEKKNRTEEIQMIQHKTEKKNDTHRQEKQLLLRSNVNDEWKKQNLPCIYEEAKNTITDWKTAVESTKQLKEEH